MNIINPPTDSLYKFCSIVGVIILLISIYLPEKMMNDLEEKVAKYKHDITIRKSEFDYEKQYIKEIELIKGLNDNTTSNKISNSTLNRMQPDKKVIYLENLIKEKDIEIINIHEYRLLLFNAIRKSETSSAQIDLSNSEIERIGKHLNAVIIIGIIGRILGPLLAAYGFWNWYYKIQIYQDKIIKKQASELE